MRCGVDGIEVFFGGVGGIVGVASSVGVPSNVSVSESLERSTDSRSDMVTVGNGVGIANGERRVIKLLGRDSLCWAGFFESNEKCGHRAWAKG